MSKCLYCGAELSEGELFCAECGKPVNAPESFPAADLSPVKKKKSFDAILMLIMSILLGLFAVFFVVALLFGKGGDTKAGDRENKLTQWDGKAVTAGAESAGPESIVVKADGTTKTTGGEKQTEETEKPDESTEATESTETTESEPKVNTYLLVEDDCTWEEAYEYCEEFGGHLVTITSEEEYDAVCDVIDDCGLTYLWIGATSDEDGTWSEWITGEGWGYENWYPGEPTGTDADGTKETCLCLWNVNDSGWTFNDMRNNLIGAVSSASGKVGFVIEFE